MTLGDNVINTMREELNSIADNNPTENTLGIISNRRAFAKTETYRKLKKNELSNEEMYFLLNNYRYGSKEIAEFLVDAISDLTAEKLVAIGGLESILTQTSNELNYFWDLTNALVDKFKMDNPSKSLNVILKYLTTDEKISSDIMGVNRVMNIIIDKRFSPHINRELVPKRNQPVYNEKEKELIIAIKDNYSLIFNLTSNRQKIEEEKGYADLKWILWGNDLNNIYRYISDNYSNQVSKIACFLINTFRKCPYIEIDFVIDYINTQTKLPKEVQLIVLYTLLCSRNLDPIIDFDKALKYCENLYEKSGISKGLHEILTLVTEENINIFDIFIKRVSNLNDITKERSNEIYKYYFKNQRKRNGAFTESLKLKAMIGLKLSDLEIAEEVRRLSQRGINTYSITSNFHCNPEKPYTYPGFYTMKEIMILGLTNMNLYEFERKNFANMSYKDLVQEFFFKYYKNFDGKIVITWKMANNPSFIKSLLMELNGHSYKIEQIMEMINIKNIGFKKYMDILEDIQRNSNNDRFFVSNEFGYIKNTFAAFHQKALRFATDSEIYMYKHKIPTSLLLSSRYCTYEVFDYFLKRIESNKVSKDVVFDVIPAIIRGVENNKKLTQEQQIDILVRIGKKPFVSRFYNVKNLKSKTITFNVANSENLTVKDFQNYYSKIREVK
jgi:hypothetical protein